MAAIHAFLIFYFLSHSLLTVSGQSNNTGEISSSRGCWSPGVSPCGNNTVFLIQKQADLNTLGSCTTYNGTLYINSTASSDLGIQNSSIVIPIQTITGALYITSTDNNSPITEIIANSLISVGSSNSTSFPQTDIGLSIIGFPSLQNLSFPLLQTISGSLNISLNPDLPLVSLSALQSVGGDLDLTGNFTKILWPNLVLVNGTALVESTYASINCGRKLGQLFRDVTVEGAMTCFAGVEYPSPWPLPSYSPQVNSTGTSSNPTSTENGTKSKATKKTMSNWVIGMFSKGTF